jgi:ABC-type Zn uptake system ZnuABC Zn-binding protein ZnuA
VGPRVVATIHPVAAVVEALAGDAATVRTLLPPGANTHGYEPTPREAETLADADLVVRVGGPADGWLPESPGAPVVTFTDGLELVGEAGREHGQDSGNPHVWLDPIRVRDVLVPRVEEALVRLVPDSADGIRGRAAAYTDSLTALDEEIRALLGEAPSRRFMSAHPAWPYFAERYGLEAVGAVHSGPASEPGSRGLARLVDEARRLGVRAVLAEPQLGRSGADALADELDARVAIADPMGGPELAGREDYLSLMRFNAAAFARALGARP